VKTASIMLVLGLLAGCGGGGSDSGGGGAAGSAPAPAPAPAPSGIGSAGGTVTGPASAQVVIPAGALSTDTQIAVTQSGAGAPAIPAGITAVGDMFSFTPHGTTFAKPVTLTVPFDPAQVPPGAVLVLYKTNASGGWEVVHGATRNGNTISAQATGFSVAFIALQPVDGFPELTEKHWTLDAEISPTAPRPLVEDEQTGGIVDRELTAGEELPFYPDNQPDPPLARFGVFSNASGKTFWTRAQAPHRGFTDPHNLDTTSADLRQVYTFKVRDPNASLKFIISSVSLETLDDGGNSPGQVACPWLDANASAEVIENDCTKGMTLAEVEVGFTARGVLSPDDFYEKFSLLQLYGVANDWAFEANDENSVNALFDRLDFDIALHDTRTNVDDHALVKLKNSKVVEIPLTTLAVGEDFNVEVLLSSEARDRVQGESYVSAEVRDPVDFNEAVTIEMSGLEQLPVNHDPVPVQVPVACVDPDGKAGQFSFGAPEYRIPENNDRATVAVQRTGGTHGEVKVQVDTADGTAIAGSDYEATHIVVRFADGEGGTKYVQIPLIADDVAEPNETAQLTLKSFSGCATLGTQSNATLSILDDDRPVPPPETFTVGGTITGLTGSGLVLADTFTGPVTSISTSTFTLANALQIGAPYDVRVTTQPSNPAQNCTVANGSGVVQGANVTNVVVTCAGLAPSGSLDDSFGNHGKVVSPVFYQPNLLENRIGMALQQDGKILVVGGLKLLRFNADGTPDSTFGTAGVVDVVLGNQSDDQAMDVVVQSTGKIVVAGSTSTAFVGSDDFALVRYNPDGTVDTTFGDSGHVKQDFFKSTDNIWRLKLLDHDRLMAVGTAIKPVQVGATTTAIGLFGLARYTADGAPDTTFAGDGLYADATGGSIASGRAVLVQDDGKYMLAGNTRADGNAAPQPGFIRLIGDGATQLPGTPDDTFGPQSSGGLQLSLVGADEIVDLVELADQTVLGLVDASQLGSTGFGLVRVPPAGVPIPKFVAPLITFTTDGDRPHGMLMQGGDKKIVLVGQAGNLSNNADMAIVRLDADGGTLDTTFGNGGKLTLDFFGGRDDAEAVVQQPDGKLIVAGYANTSSGNVFALARLAQ